MATQAERDAIIAEATRRNPSNPQMALWEYAQSIGFSPAQIDEYMGWGAGTSQNWAQANGLMQPTYGVESQQEGEVTTRTPDGYMKTVGDKNYYYDTQGNFLRGHRDAGNGWTAPINASGADTAPAQNTSRDNSFGGTISNYVSGLSQSIASNPAMMAAITAIAATAGVPPAAVAAVLGGNRTAVDGNLLAGIETAAASYGLGQMVGSRFIPAAETTDALSGTVAPAANPMQLDPATMQGQIPSSIGTPPVPTFTPNTPGGTIPSVVQGGTPTVPPVVPTGTPTTLPTVISQIPGVNNLPPWLQQMLPGLLTTAGGIVSGNSAVDAARTQADAQIRAAQIAADAAKFRPVGIRTNFGSSQFGYDANGNLTSAGYTLSPELQAAMGQLAGQAGGLLTQAGNAQSATSGMSSAAQRAIQLGRGYLAANPQAQAARYLADQRGLLAPSRAADMAALQATMQAQGRGGFAIGGGVNGQGAANPQLQALLNSQMQQDAQLAADATRGGMDYAKFGAGMVGTGGDLLSSMYNTQTAAYNPFNTALKTATTIEGMGQNALQMGMDMGSTVTAANRNASGLLATGMTNAANTMAPANAYSPWGALLSGAGNSMQGYKFDPMTGVKL